MDVLVTMLMSKRLTIGSVESMTGGLFASELASVPGVSKTFKGSLVTYTKKTKEKLLGIPEKLIEEKGIVSSEVAYQMAKRGQTILSTDICVSITGNAGPTSEPGQEGVGVCYIGIAYKDGVRVYRKVFEGSRNEIRNKAVLSMKDLAIEVMKEKYFNEN